MNNNPITPERIQEYDRYRQTFPSEAHSRRLSLMQKLDDGFTEEEMKRPFADNPVWMEECRRRSTANLADDEWKELTALTRHLDKWRANAPWMSDKRKIQQQFEAQIREIAIISAKLFRNDFIETPEEPC